jgi:ribonuclease BN (tRNA processing enzyme)
MASVNVTTLGTGDAFASRGRFQSGYVITAPGSNTLVDAGPTVLASMKRCGISPADIDTVLISHLHGDHFGGLPFLILEYMWETKRRKNLTIAGPRHLEQRTWSLFRGMYPESDTTEVARKMRFVVLEPGQPARLNKIHVQSARTPHTVKDISLALRVTVGDKLIAYSGDTGWTDELPEISRGADLFLCECTYFESVDLSFHLNYPLIAANRRRFDTKRMILTHIGREVLEHDHEISIEMAHDAMRIEL